MFGIGVGDRRHLDQLGAGQPQHVLLLLGLGVGNHDHGAIAERRADDREADSGIAGGALDDDPARTQRAARDRVLDDRQRRAILDRAARIHEFGLAEDRAAGRLRGGRSRISGVRPMASTTDGLNFMASS